MQHAVIIRTLRTYRIDVGPWHQPNADSGSRFERSVDSKSRCTSDSLHLKFYFRYAVEFARQLHPASSWAVSHCYAVDRSGWRLAAVYGWRPGRVTIPGVQEKKYDINVTHEGIWWRDGYVECRQSLNCQKVRRGVDQGISSNGSIF